MKYLVKLGTQSSRVLPSDSWGHVVSSEITDLSHVVNKHLTGLYLGNLLLHMERLSEFWHADRSVVMGSCTYE